jgi:hypothetical protein
MSSRDAEHVLEALEHTEVREVKEATGSVSRAYVDGPDSPEDDMRHPQRSTRTIMNTAGTARLPTTPRHAGQWPPRSSTSRSMR